MRFFYGDFEYLPVAPRSDYEPSDPLDEKNSSKRRLMFRHDHDGPHFFVAPANEMQAGLVIGVEA